MLPRMLELTLCRSTNQAIEGVHGSLRCLYKTSSVDSRKRRAWLNCPTCTSAFACQCQSAVGKTKWTHYRTFEDAIRNGKAPVMSKQRLKMVQRDLFEQLDQMSLL